MDHNVFIGIGSNIGNRILNCRQGILNILQHEKAQFKAVSSLYTTSPVSDIEQQDFLNCALSILWNASAEELLLFLQSIEVSMGRIKYTPKGPRIIDLDILLFNDTILETHTLTIPHPELHKRKFAIIPCIDIDHTIIHPVFQRPLREFLLSIHDSQKIVLLKNRKEWQDFIFKNNKERGNRHA